MNKKTNKSSESTVQEKLSDLSYDQRLIDAAKEIIRNGSCAVSKHVRAGFTTSAIIACEQEGLRLLVIAPTKRILNETVSKASGNAIRITGNNECLKLNKLIEENPILEQIPLPPPDCDQCGENGRCKVLDILNVDDFSTVTMTYSKLEALMLAKSNKSKEILEKLKHIDVVILDEAHTLSLPSIVCFKTFEKVDIPNKFRALKKMYELWLELCHSLEKEIQDLNEKAGKSHSNQHLAITLSNKYFQNWSNLKPAWQQLIDLALNHSKFFSSAQCNEHVIELRDIITILGSQKISLCYIAKGKDVEGGVYIAADYDRLYITFKWFLTRRASRAKHIYVSGTLVERRPGYFSELSRRPIKNVIFPDFRDATKRMTLIPDRWKLTDRNFLKSLPRIVETIKEISAKEKQPIYLWTVSKSKAEILELEINKLGMKDIFVDYYRSDRTLGVERSERVCIAVGMAEIPANSYDALADGTNDKERWLDSRKLRRQSVDAATWQAVNRVRDPEGKVDSRIYFVGCRIDQVLQVATWGTKREIAERGFKKIKGSNTKEIETPIFDVVVEQALELPKIYSENSNRDRPDRRSVEGFIKSIELNQDDSINFQKADIFSNNNRENVQKLRIYNFPIDENELNLTVNALHSMFVNRNDCFAFQRKNPQTEVWEYQKCYDELTEEDICNHICGYATFGVYQIGLDDQVIWCCDDMDSHHGETDAREKVTRLIGVLRKYGIPFLLEASGSPKSYHIWIFLARTKTINAFHFIRQINREARVKCEAWPRQKALTGKSKYGNLVKLPIGVNRKSGVRSVFLEADTFEPIEGPILHPNVVHLFEQDHAEGLHIKTEVRNKASRLGKNLKYCMQRALEDGMILDGSEGHHLRLAIAVEGRSIGMRAPDIARLFKHQPDYDFDISLAKVQEVWTYDYYSWSCDTLREKCGDLVERYCSACPLALKNFASMCEAVS
jgi:hypothetical protein